VNLINQISRLPVEVQAAAADLRPLNVASMAYEMARAFNDFYNQCPVLQADEPVRSARLHLVAATRQTLANSLALMGITAPQAM
jgi:arginyl-tRNA synthetase